MINKGTQCHSKWNEEKTKRKSDDVSILNGCQIHAYVYMFFGVYVSDLYNCHIVMLSHAKTLNTLQTEQNDIQNGTKKRHDKHKLQNFYCMVFFRFSCAFSMKNDTSNNNNTFCIINMSNIRNDRDRWKKWLLLLAMKSGGGFSVLSTLNHEPSKSKLIEIN